MDKIYEISKLIKELKELSDKIDMEFLQLTSKHLANNVRK